MSVYGCSPKCCILNMCGVLELLENCFVIEIQMYNKRFAFASMSTQYADAGEVNKYIIILEKPYCRPSIYETNGAGCVILAHIIQF